MRAAVLTKQLTAASANTIAVSQTLGGAGNLTINGASASGGVATLDTQRRVIITSAGNDSGIIWTVIGTDDNGNAIKDSFAGGNIAAAQSNLNFKTVTQVSSSGAAAAAVTVGTNTVGSTPWKLLADTIATPNMSFDVAVVATVNYSVEYTEQDILLPIPSPLAPTSAIALGSVTPNPTATAFTGLSGLAVAAQANANFLFRGWRLTINSGTGSATCTGRQAGLASP